MTKYKVQNLRSLREEMKAVARGERSAPADAGKPSFNSVDAVVRLLTPENRQLLAIIRDRKPQSVAELVEMSGRAQPNVTRTLAKMVSAGFITMKAVAAARHRALPSRRSSLRSILTRIGTDSRSLSVAKSVAKSGDFRGL